MGAYVCPRQSAKNARGYKSKTRTTALSCWFSGSKGTFRVDGDGSREVTGIVDLENIKRGRSPMIRLALGALLALMLTGQSMAANFKGPQLISRAISLLQHPTASCRHRDGIASMAMANVRRARIGMARSD
jgi:hypothetical protein